MMSAFHDLSTPTGAAFQNPSLGPGYMNSERFRTAEMPSMNGHGTARAVAHLYSQIGGLLPRELLDEATRTQSIGLDQVLKSRTRFGLGFMLHHAETPVGFDPDSFGHAGAGGSIGFCDPARRLGFCFAMNQMEEGVIAGSQSAREIIARLYDCLD